MREERANRYRFGKGMIMSEKSIVKPKTEKSARQSEVISPINLTGFSALESELDNSMIAKKTKNALRKNVIKTIRGIPEPEPVEETDEGIPTQQEGGASKTSRPRSNKSSSDGTSFGKDYRKPQRFIPAQNLNETEEQTSIYTSNYPLGSQRNARSTKQTFESKSEAPKRSRTPYRKETEMSSERSETGRTSKSKSRRRK